jgi:hypothetical protein
VGWQPSRFRADRAEAERVFALAERLGNFNAAAATLGTTWPWLCKAFTRHSLGMPARNPEEVRRRAIGAAHKRTRQPVTSPWTRCSWPSIPGALLARDRPAAELSEWVRRDEEYAILGANVVELHSESHARRPTTWDLGGHPSRRVQLPIGQPMRQPTTATPGAGGGCRSPLIDPHPPVSDA